VAGAFSCGAHYNAMAYDMEVGGDIFTIELAHGDVHIFWNH
jgi:hypothetical protein